MGFPNIASPGAAVLQGHLLHPPGFSSLLGFLLLL